MNNKSTFLACTTILIGFAMVSLAIVFSNKDNTIANENSKNINQKYEILSPNDSNIIIFDKENGTIWKKAIEPNEGPTDWTKEDLSFLQED